LSIPNNYSFNFDIKLNQISHVRRNIDLKSQIMLKFDEPIPTKSGDDVVKIWSELQECWATYKKARLESDLPTMRQYANKIRDLQDDLGITQAEFPELRTEQINSQ